MPFGGAILAIAAVTVPQAGTGARHDVDRGQPALVEAALAHGFALLLFPSELEARFLKDSEAARFKMILIAGLASVVLFAGLMIADVMMMPDLVTTGLILRIGVYAPVTASGLYLLHKLRMPLVTEWMVAAGGVFAGLLSVLMYVSSTSRWAFPAVVELNIVVIFICAFARFWPALAMSILIAMMHAFVIATVHDVTGVLATNTSLLLAVTIAFALYGNYKLEHEERLAYLLDLREKALDAEMMAAHDRLADMAITDALTGVANRRHFDGFLQACSQRAQQAQGSPLSLLMVDIDYFKPYNDHYGHQAGDRCLIAVAQALKACLRRPGDLVARWGGEEFAVVMPDADAQAAEAAGERVRRAVHALGLPHGASSCAPVVSVSVGVACAHAGPALTVAGLLQTADAALYQAKTAGRNRVSWGQQQRPAQNQSLPSWS